MSFYEYDPSDDPYFDFDENFGPDELGDFDDYDPRDDDSDDGFDPSLDNPEPIGFTNTY